MPELYDNAPEALQVRETVRIALEITAPEAEYFVPFAEAFAVLPDFDDFILDTFHCTCSAFAVAETFVQEEEPPP